MDYEASISLNRRQIRDISRFFRKLMGVRTILFPVMKVLDRLETKFKDSLYVSVEEDDNFEYREMATLKDEGNGVYCIRIRESVYLGAIKGNRACLGFICHEMCHFVLVYIFGVGPKQFVSSDGIAYARACADGSLKPWKSMEWQAKALCGETMIPYCRCKDMTFDQIVEKTMSSDEQTEYFLGKVVKRDRQ